MPRPRRCWPPVGCGCCARRLPTSRLAPVAVPITVRQLIESVNDTLKGQLDLERHGGRTIEGVTVRVLQRRLALTATIWHNHSTGQPVMRSLIA
jgi:hypothetical protein